MVGVSVFSPETIIPSSVVHSAKILPEPLELAASKEISELIRRVSISLFKREESASLTGQNWLLFLDQLNGDKSFSNGIGKTLIEAPYQAKPDYDAVELLALISSWIDSAKKNTVIQNNVSHKRNQS